MRKQIKKINKKVFNLRCPPGNMKALIAKEK